MTEEELRKRLGDASFDEMKKTVQDAKARGENPDQIVAAVRAKFQAITGVANNVQTFIQVFLAPPKA